MARDWWFVVGGSWLVKRVLGLEPGALEPPRPLRSYRVPREAGVDEPRPPQWLSLVSSELYPIIYSRILTLPGSRVPRLPTLLIRDQIPDYPIQLYIPDSSDIANKFPFTKNIACTVNLFIQLRHYAAVIICPETSWKD